MANNNHFIRPIKRKLHNVCNTKYLFFNLKDKETDKRRFNYFFHGNETKHCLDVFKCRRLEDKYKDLIFSSGRK